MFSILKYDVVVDNAMLSLIIIIICGYVLNKKWKHYQIKTIHVSTLFPLSLHRLIDEAYLESSQI